MLDHFDIIAPLYDKFGANHYPSALERCLKLPSPGWLLDAGGGTGRLTQHLTGSVKKIVVLDTSIGMLRESHKKGSLLPVLSPVEYLPFADSTFDRIVVSDALHHFTDQQAAIGELARVLKSGGRLVIEEPDIRLATIKILALVEKLLRMKSRFLRPAKIVGLLEQQGLRAQIERSENFRAWITADKPLFFDFDTDTDSDGDF